MKDNFSGQAPTYSMYRPAYPGDLFEFILSHCKGRKTAWDCATGNGQAATELSKHFETVYATDISQKQLDHAHQEENIFYSVQAAEKTDLPSHSIDLVTVAQAIHWFDRDKFFAEVKRVARAGAWLAVWMYDLPRISDPVDEIIHKKLYRDIVGPSWDPERKLIDDHYRSISFPFKEIDAPVFFISPEWTQEELLGYLGTWSAVQKYISVHKTDPLDLVRDELTSAWQNEKMSLAFQVYLRLGRVKD